MKIKIILLSCAFSIISGQAFSAWFSSSQPQYVSEKWVNGETNTKLDELLSKNKYSEVILNLKHFINEQKDESALKWTRERAKLGYVCLLHFLVNHYYQNFNLGLTKDHNELKNMLALMIASLILTRIDVVLCNTLSHPQKFTNFNELSNTTYKNLVTIYKKYAETLVQKYSYDYKECLKKAIDFVDQIFIEKKSQINPAWIIATHISGYDIFFDNPKEEDCLFMLGNTNEKDLLSLRQNIHHLIYYQFNQCTSWKDLLS